MNPPTIRLTFQSILHFLFSSPGFSLFSVEPAMYGAPLTLDFHVLRLRHRCPGSGQEDEGVEFGGDVLDVDLRPAPLASSTVSTSESEQLSVRTFFLDLPLDASVGEDWLALRYPAGPRPKSGRPVCGRFDPSQEAWTTEGCRPNGPFPVRRIPEHESESGEEEFSIRCRCLGTVGRYAALLEALPGRPNAFQDEYDFSGPALISFDLPGVTDIPEWEDVSHLLHFLSCCGDGRTEAESLIRLRRRLIFPWLRNAAIHHWCWWRDLLSLWIPSLCRGGTIAGIRSHSDSLFFCLLSSQLGLVEEDGEMVSGQVCSNFTDLSAVEEFFFELVGELVRIVFEPIGEDFQNDILPVYCVSQKDDAQGSVTVIMDFHPSPETLSGSPLTPLEVAQNLADEIADLESSLQKSAGIPPESLRLAVDTSPPPPPAPTTSDPSKPSGGSGESDSTDLIVSLSPPRPCEHCWIHHIIRSSPAPSSSVTSSLRSSLHRSLAESSSSSCSQSGSASAGGRLEIQGRMDSGSQRRRWRRWRSWTTVFNPFMHPSVDGVSPSGGMNNQ